ncbi:MAG: hypothetical protein ACK5LK_07700 [Chthoniobacterales bacterium]
MPRDILQSFWYYGEDFENEPRGKAFKALNDAGFDQIPTCSCFYSEKNPQLLIEHCHKVVSPQHLVGFLQTPWRPTVPEYHDVHLQAIQHFNS